MDSHHQPGGVGIAGLVQRPLQGGAQVVLVGFQAGHPGGHLEPAQMAIAGAEALQVGGKVGRVIVDILGVTSCKSTCQTTSCEKSRLRTMNPNVRAMSQNVVRSRLTSNLR